MKVLHLCDEPWDSGITAYALDAVRTQKQRGLSVVIGVRSGKIPEIKAKEQGLPTLPLNSWVDLLKIIKSTQWDVINTHTGRPHTWLVIFRALGWLKDKTPVLIRTRGDARPLSTHLLSKYVYRLTDGVIAASQHVGNQYKNFLSKTTSLDVVYPMVYMKPYIKPPSSKVVGLLGRLDPVKGHAVLLEAAAQLLKDLPDTKFRFAGREANVSVQLLENQAQQLGIEKNVEFLGFVDSVQEFIQSCSIGVVASLGSEEVSRACLEWMSGGRPVVGTLVGSLPELIQTQETGFLVPPGDSVAMGDALYQLLSKPQIAEDYGRRANQWIHDHFSEEIFASQTKAHYESCLSLARKA